MSKRKISPVNYEDEHSEDGVEEEGRTISESNSDNEDKDGDDDQSSMVEAGLITKIHMEEFMCHRKFTIDLGKKVNFITGQNGSGKSAIVAAIQLCLGATARNTGRGTCLGKLIREGSNGPAVVCVTLLNEGEDAYKKGTYGNRITIERTILKRGGGGYRLLDKSNKLISKDKTELERLLHHLNIMVENPCCVLTQEESKKFIQGVEKDKYEFFLKATGLERTWEEIDIVRLTLEETVARSESTKEKLTVKVDHCKKLKHELSAFEGLQKLEDEIRGYMMKACWDAVATQEEKIRELNEERSICEEKVSEAQELLRKEESKQPSGDDFNAVEAELQEVDREVELITPTLEAFNAERRSRNQELMAIKEDILRLESSKRDFTIRLTNANNNIRELREKAMANAEGGRERQLLEQIQNHMSAMDEIRVEEEHCKTELRTLSETHNRVHGTVSELTGQLRSVQSSVNSLQKELETMTKSSNDKSAAFGLKIPEILAAIGRTRFQGPVHGPIGMFVKLRDATLFNNQVGFPIEKVLTPVLSNFIVTNDNDRNTLSRILKSLQCDRDIRIYSDNSRGRHNIQKITGVETVADLIIVENDTVFNVLIDQCHIEFTAIAENYEDSRRRYVEGEFGRKQLRNGLRLVYTVDGSQLEYRRGCERFSANTNSREKYRKLIDSDMSEIVAQMQAQLDEERQVVHEIQNNVNAENAQLRSILQRRQEIEKRLVELSRNKQRTHRNIESLNEQLTDTRQAQFIDTSPMEAEAQELEQALRQLEDQITSKIDESRSAKHALDSVISDHQNEKRRGDALKTRAESLRQKLQEFIDKKEQLNHSISVRKRNLVMRTAELEKIDTFLNKEMTKRDEIEATARDQCLGINANWDGERPTLKRTETKDYIDNKLQRLREQLRRQKEIAGLQGRTKEIVAHELETALADYHQHNSDFQSVQENVERITLDHKIRSKQWRRQQKNLGTMVDGYFDSYMQSKGGSGQVKFDHVLKTLEIHTNTDNQDSNTQCTDVRQLSGGERSFTTLCLLLALGHVIESPFRIMDEYDVFLDQHARELTLQNLQHYALQPDQRGRQFIIVTPQELKGVITTKDVRIHRMPKPQRLSAHGLQQTTLG